MKVEGQEEQETQSNELDIEAAAAEISSDLFGQEGEEETSNKSTEGEGEQLSDGGENVDVAASSPQPAEGEKEPKAVEGEVVEENSAEVQAVGAPKTWTKEALEDWAKIPARAQQEILKREDDMMRGIQGYKEAADLGVRYSKVVEPYAPILAAENVDPVGLFQSFAANHYLLSRGTPEQKVQLAAQLINGYNIPLADLLNHIADSGIEPADPQVAALQRELDELKGLITTRDTAEQTRQKEAIDAEIAAFAKDPAHPYFDELAADISKLFEAGAASSLQEAYDKAVWANPNTRQKELARVKDEEKAAADAEAKRLREKAAKLKADQVEVTGKPRDGTVPRGSMDDTLNETYAEIANRA